jgi:hypothetical protein
VLFSSTRLSVAAGNSESLSRAAGGLFSALALAVVQASPNSSHPIYGRQVSDAGHGRPRSSATWTTLKHEILLQRIAARTHISPIGNRIVHSLRAIGSKAEGEHTVGDLTTGIVFLT